MTTLPYLTPERTAAEVAALERLLAVVAGARVLDAGCGHGRHAAGLVARGLAVVGVDLDDVALGLARVATGSGPGPEKQASGFGLQASGEAAGVPWAERERGVAVARSLEPAAGLPGFFPVRADLGCGLPFRDAALDGAYAWYTSLFLFDDATNGAVLSELARVLRPGARLVHQSVDPAALAARGEETVRVPLPRGGHVEETSRFDPATGRDEGVRRAVLPYGRVLEGRFSLRYHAPAKLVQLALRAGFREARCLRAPEAGLHAAPDALVLVAIR